VTKSKRRPGNQMRSKAFFGSNIIVEQYNFFSKLIDMRSMRPHINKLGIFVYCIYVYLAYGRVSFP
jgi:hypothetical protein